jgi:hypothetical protein
MSEPRYHVTEPDPSQGRGGECLTVAFTTQGSREEILREAQRLVSAKRGASGQTYRVFLAIEIGTIVR